MRGEVIIERFVTFSRRCFFVLLFFVIIGTVGIPIMVMNLTQEPLLASINILQGVLQMWATILLFRIPKCDRNED